MWFKTWMTYFFLQSSKDDILKTAGNHPENIHIYSLMFHRGTKIIQILNHMRLSKMTEFR